MITSIIPCCQLSLLILLPSLIVVAEEQDSAPERTGLMAEVQAALAAEDNALTQDNLQTKLTHLTTARAKLEDFRSSQETTASPLSQEAPITAQKRQALIAEQSQLQAKLTTNEAKMTQIRQQLQMAEGEEAKELNEVLEQIQDQNITINSRLQEIETALAATTEETHTVQTGESLSIIAERYYGDIQRWQDIFEANRTIISDPDVIEVGMILTIPLTPESSIKVK